MSASPWAHGTRVAERERRALQQVERRIQQAGTEIERDMLAAERSGTPYTGMTYQQLMTAAKGWKRAARKRASDLSLDLDDYPTYVDAQYKPPHQARRAAQLKIYKNPAGAGKYWRAYQQKYVKGKKDEKEKRSEEPKMASPSTPTPQAKKMPSKTWRPKPDSGASPVPPTC